MNELSEKPLSIRGMFPPSRGCSVAGDGKGLMVRQGPNYKKFRRDGADDGATRRGVVLIGTPFVVPEPQLAGYGGSSLQEYGHGQSLVLFEIP